MSQISHGLRPSAHRSTDRLTLNDDDKRVREWFISQVTKYGCTVKIDAVGNIFATRPGTNNSLPPIGLGSHLDTQPAGGKYDGIVGIYRHNVSADFIGIFDKDLVSKLPSSVKWIAHNGAGYDNIDVKACTERGIQISSTPIAVNDATADGTH